MKRKATMLILAGLTLTGVSISGGYWYAMQRMSNLTAQQQAAPGENPVGPTAESGKTGAAGERKPLYWHDPMVPGSKFDKPGKSPFMDMQLVAVYADAGADEGGVTISPRTAQNLGIRTAEVKTGSMATSLSTVGTVNIDENTIITVQSRVNGYIEKLYVRAQYDFVTRGQPLAEIYAPEWLAAQEEYLVLQRSRQPDASTLAQAARQRLLLLGVSEQQLLHVDKTGQANPRVTLYAPQSGVVWELGARDGMAVNPGLTLFKLANLSSVWVNAEIPETDAALIRPGLPVEARATSLPEQKFKGKVAVLLPDVSATTRTIKARVVLANPGGHLKPGMYTTLAFGGTDKAVLMAPSEAVIHTGTRAVVILAEGNGKFRPVEVEAGRDSGGMTEIRKGLKSGQHVVASGQFLIDSESSLKSTLSRLESSQGGTSGNTESGGHVGTAKVNAIDMQKGKIDLSHGPIPSLKWPAMAMGFSVEDKAQLQDIKPGDEIEFELRGEPNKDDEYVITRIKPKTKGAAK